MLLLNIFMRRKIKTVTESTMLDYISPWKYQDSSRPDHEYLLTKNKILEEIIVPATQEFRKIKKTPINIEINSSPRKTSRTHDKTLSQFKKYCSRRCSVQTEQTEHHQKGQSKKQIDESKLFQKIIFVRKNMPSAKVAVVSLGLGDQQQGSSGQLLNKSQISNKMRRSPDLKYSKNLHHPRQANLSFFMEKSSDTHLKYKRIEFKQLTLSLFNKINYSTNYKSDKKIEQQTLKLNKTLHHFLNKHRQF